MDVDVLFPRARARDVLLRARARDVLPRGRRGRLGAVPAIAGSLALLAAGCGMASGTASGTAPGQARDADGGCITSFREGTDYYPDKVSVTDAKGFSVEYHGYYKVVTVAQATQGGQPERYVLVRCGAPVPKLTGDLASAPVVTVPVKRVASASTTQLPALDLLGSVDAVAAVGTPRLVSTPSVVERIKAGKVTGFASASGEVSVERVLAAKPDLYLAGGMAGGMGAGTGDTATKAIAAAKVPAVADSAWLEGTPLGRAEWVKYFALFLDREAQATTAYTKIADAYRKTRASASAVTTRPTSIVGKQHKGIWYVSAGQSYVAALLRDAGSDYVFADLKGTGSVPVGIETVLSKGASAQYWLNAEMTAGWHGLGDVTREDPRYQRLAAVRAGRIWSPVKRINAGGGNDYWESGVVHPDLVLADLVAILHPDLLPGHQLAYYVKLGA